MENIDNLIIERLGEHQRKVAFISAQLKNEQVKRSPFRKTVYAIGVIAACCAILFVVSPLLFKGNSISDMQVETPSFMEYRGSGYEKIENLINENEYSGALEVVDHELAEIEEELSSFMSTEISEEEKIYMTTLCNDKKEELLWCKIYLLMKLGRIHDLKTYCNSYLNNNDFQAHREDVKLILKKIK